MLKGGYYVVEYNYKDTRGHIRSKRLMRGTFDLVLPIYKELAKLVKANDKHKPIAKPRLIGVHWGNSEEELDFKKELEEWRSLKSDIKK